MNPNAKAYVLIALVLLLSFYCLAWADEDQLVWSTYLGGGNDEEVYDVAVDDSGYVHVTGQTKSSDFPVTLGAYDFSPNGNFDAFIAKLKPDGTSLEFSTYLGGSGVDVGRALNINNSGDIFVAGETNYSDFPTTPGAFDTTHNAGSSPDYDVFVSKLNSTGDSLIYSTFVGGYDSEGAYDIALDSLGYVFATGYTGSDNFPTTQGAFDTSYTGQLPPYGQSVFVFKLNPTGTALEYSTFLEGQNWDGAQGITVDNIGNCYVTGFTGSSNFPVTTSCWDTTYNGKYDAFVTKLNTTGSDLVYSSYLGGTEEDYGRSICLSNSQQACLTGYTKSSDFPTTFGAFDTSYSGSTDLFVVRLDSAGNNIEYATFIGGSSGEENTNMAIDLLGNIYLTGETNSVDFPVCSSAYDTTFNGSVDAFVLRLSKEGDMVEYSTFLGGSEYDYGFSIAVDISGVAYIAGRTESSDFPTTIGAFDTTYGGDINYGWDGFVSKLIIDLTPPEAVDDLTATLHTGMKSYWGHMYLSWTEPYDNIGVSHYVIYRSTEPYVVGDSLASTQETFYLDVGTAGNPYINYFYAVRAVDWGETKSPASNQVGEFDKPWIVNKGGE